MFANKVTGSTKESTANESKESISISREKGENMPSKVIHLSNRDRLMLRKQALKMKKRPVLAVGIFASPWVALCFSYFLMLLL